MTRDRPARARVRRARHGALYCAADGAPMVDAGTTLHDRPIVRCADCGAIALVDEGAA